MKLTEKQKNCPYCHTKQVIYGKPNWMIAINPSSHSVHAMSSDDKLCLFDINYCPMCGRYLLNEEEE